MEALKQAISRLTSCQVPLLSFLLPLRRRDAEFRSLVNRNRLSWPQPSCVVSFSFGRPPFANIARCHPGQEKRKEKKKKKKTEVVATSSQQRHHPAPAGPLTRSAMAAGPAEAMPARQQGSETSSAAPILSPSDPAPHSESHQKPTSRKRTTSINTEEANRPKIENLTLNPPSTASPRPFDTSSGLICLCTPEPKVPRPRNGMSCLPVVMMPVNGASSCLLLRYCLFLVSPSSLCHLIQGRIRRRHQTD